MSLFEENIYCRQCQGSCYSRNNFETQKKALENFGVIPNNCVVSCDGTSHCPYDPNKK